MLEYSYLIKYSEVQRLKAETHENTCKTKENVETLKKNIADIENLIESKNKTILRQSKHLRLAINSLQNCLSESGIPLTLHCEHLLEYIN